MSLMKMIIFLSQILALLGVPCNTVQYWSMGSDDHSKYPTEPIMDQFEEQIKLADITFTSGTSQYTITKLEANPKIQAFVPSAQGQDLIMNIAVEYEITFKLKDALGVIVALGIARTNDVPIFVAMTWGPTPMNWTATRVVYDSIATIESLRLTDSSLYAATLQAITQDTLAPSIGEQIQTYLQSFDIITRINADLFDYFDDQFESQYTYKYKNVNYLTQIVNLNTSVLGVAYENDYLSVQREFSIIDQTNNLCEQLMPHPLAHQEGHEAEQITSFSIKSISSIFNYALDNKYFDAILNSKWNSPIFQFSAGSLRNVFDGINGNYPLQDPFKGVCNSLSAGQEPHVQDGLFHVTLWYTCSITFGEAAVVTFSFTLRGGVRITSDIKHLKVMGVGFSASDIRYTPTATFPLKNEGIANLYLNSVVGQALNDQALFGSGFPSLWRSKHIGSTIGTDITIYQYNL